MKRPPGTHPIYWQTNAQLPPSDWQPKPISDYAAIEKGRMPTELLDEPTATSLPYFLIEGLLDGALTHTEETDLPRIEENDTAVVGDGSRSGLAIRGLRGVLGSTLLRYRALPETNPDYLFYLLESLYPYTNTATIGGAIPHLDKRLLASLEISCPEIGEQQEISALLRITDEAIQKTKAELEATRRLKKALMQQLFTRGMPGRHKHYSARLVLPYLELDMPSEWDVDTLGKSVVSVQYGTNSAANDYQSGFPVVAIPQVIAPHLKLADMPYVELDSEDAESLKLAEKDVLLIRTNGNAEYIGNSTVVTPEVANSHVVFASYLIRVKTNPCKLDGRYLNYFLSSPVGRKQSLAMANTSAGNHNIGSRAIKQFVLPRPGIDEQHEIVNLLDNLEQTLNRIEGEIAALERLKKSLLQNLLTGKVRVSMDA